MCASLNIATQNWENGIMSQKREREENDWIDKVITVQ